jgi:hypothetical protein
MESEELNFTRSIAFTIPGTAGSPGVNIQVVEVNGALSFSLEVDDTGPHTGDLRGLFFDLNSMDKLAGLAFSGSDVTGMDTINVIDLGDGVNLKGAASSFDVGVKFGTQGIGTDDIQSTSFLLTNTENNLTLDDIANVLFGTRLASVGDADGNRNDSVKLTVTAPAAPDAVADAYTIFEDGQSDLDSPSTVPQGILFEVLANDTDADGDTLTITDVAAVQHGTVQIVDGADADTLPGDAIRYTPFEDYSGTDSFVYAISDNNGGTDFAAVDVTVTAVADLPELSYQILPGDTVDQIRVIATATQTDADSSEFIDRIELSGIPAGVAVDQMSYNPVSEPDQIVQEFLLTLPLGQDTSFDLGITAVSRETSNGDEEATSTTVPIAFDYNANELDQTFYAYDQSMWETGDQFVFTDDRFLGLDTSWDDSGGGFVYGASDGHIRAGFQSTLTFEGGEIDAQVPFDINLETNYNRTTDVLSISSDASLAAGALFSTEGPEGSYELDFIFDFLLNASAGLDFGELGTWDIIDLTIGPYDESFNILDVDSSDLSLQVPLPYGFSLSFAWPDIDTTSETSATDTITSSGESNNFMELGLDVDDLVFQLLSLPNPFDVGFDIGVAWGSIELADLDLSAGLNFLQEFSLAVDSLTGTIVFEDGSSQAFDFVSDIVLNNASSYDTDSDGIVEFNLELAPNVTLNNDTDLGFNVGYSFDVLKLSGGYDIVVDSGSLELGPIWSSSNTYPITAVGVYDSTFGLEFESQNLVFSA